jgi:hypothetical protein
LVANHDYLFYFGHVQEPASGTLTLHHRLYDVTAGKDVLSSNGAAWSVTDGIHTASGNLGFYGQGAGPCNLDLGTTDPSFTPDGLALFMVMLVESADTSTLWGPDEHAAYVDDPWQAFRDAAPTASVPPLAVGSLNLTTIGESSLTFSLAEPAGGVVPYGPVKVYKSTNPGFTPGADNLVATVAAPSFPQPITLTDVAVSVPQYVIATVEDDEGDVVASRESVGVVPSIPPGSAVSRSSPRFSRSLR